MKKLLLVLTVVVMASFLLVGCFGDDENTAPVITTIALPNATAGVPYTATVAANDADSDTLTYTVAGPTGMVISSTGLISGWTPAAEGTEPVTVTVTDGTDSVSADFTITIVEAAVVNTAPVITAIADQTTILGETFTYPVVATDAEADALTYSLTECPLLMEISAAGVITYAPEFDTQLGPQAVVVEVSDGIDVATEDFVLTVAPAPAPEPVVIDIDVPNAYNDTTKGLIVAAKKYDVTVTFSDNSITEGKDVWARWSDVNPSTVVNGTWVKLTKNVDYTEFTGELDFGEKTITECEDICIEVKVGTICCDPIIYSETITVDSIAPCASFTVAIEDCGEDVCDPDVPGASMTFSTTCEDICDFPYDCCGDACSGVGAWSFTLDDDVCDGPCDTEIGNDCDITGAFECGCLLYEGEEDSTGIHVIDVIIEDNVGNEFTDTWTLTFDTDELTGFTAPGATVTDNGDGTWSLDYGCTWDGCEECFPQR